MEEKDDSFVEEFMARAQIRQAKLAQIKLEKERGDVTYPPLSPLPEEDHHMDVIETPDIRDTTSFTDRAETVSQNMSELNYSSDLSLECGDEDVHRAEPVVCHSSPEHFTKQIRHSPRKQIPNLPQQHLPLQEIQIEQKPTSSHSLPEASTVEQTLRELQQKVSEAEQKRAQLKKAMNVSRHGSAEHIDAAKRLQIAEIQHVNYTNQAAIFRQGFRKKTDSLGSVTISGLELKTTTKLKDDLADDGVSHYFFCIVHCQEEVKATEIVDTNILRRQDIKAYLRFKDKITFADLPPDFNMKVEVFELVVGQKQQQLLSRLTPSKKTKITPESQFKRVGSLKLTIGDRLTDHKLLTQWSKNEESKYIERDLRFKLDIKPEQLPSKAGLLHARCADDLGCPVWTRYWVNLSNGRVRFWNTEEDANYNRKPRQILDFQDICSEKVYKLTPYDDLYRQHSFVFYTFEQVAGGDRDTYLQRIFRDDPKYKIVKYQFATRSKEARESWCAVFERSLQCFRQWYGKTRIFTSEEIEEMFYVSD